MSAGIVPLDIAVYGVVHATVGTTTYHHQIVSEFEGAAGVATRNRPAGSPG